MDYVTFFVHYVTNFCVAQIGTLCTRNSDITSKEIHKCVDRKHEQFFQSTLQFSICNIHSSFLHGELNGLQPS